MLSHQKDTLVKWWIQIGYTGVVPGQSELDCRASPLRLL